MNIEEIKKKLRNYNAEVVASRGCCDMEDFTLDIAFLIVENERLLSIVEQAEKSLELFKQLYDPNINKATSEVIETVKTMASKALKAIRKDECVHDYALIPPNEFITSQYRMCIKCHDVKWGD